MTCQCYALWKEGIALTRPKSQSASYESAPCNHIIGFHLAAFPEHGERDTLVRFSERVTLDDTFRYCPLCGKSLLFDGQIIKALRASAAS